MYNLPLNNKYAKYTHNELELSIKSKYNKDDIQLASIMAQMAKNIIIFFPDTAVANWYIYRNSELYRTPLENFSQNIKNKIYKIFIENLTLQGYISLRSLELLNEINNLSYTIYGPTDYSKNEPSTLHPRFLLRISNAPFRIHFKDINDYFNCITSQDYQILLKQKLPIFIEEYNKTHNQQNVFTYKNIDPLCTYIDLNNDKQVIKYIYTFPEFYNYLKIYSPKTEYKFWVDFFLSYKCTAVARRHQETTNRIIRRIIEKNFFDDAKLFYLIINKKSVSHISIYFSKKLKANLRKDLNLSLICYSNCCIKHRKELKKMLGPKITLSARFKYMFGSSK